MFIDLLTQDEFKRSINTVILRNLELLILPKEDLKSGLEGHLVVAVSDVYLEEIEGNPKALDIQPEKILGNFLIFTNKTVTVTNHRTTTSFKVTLKLDSNLVEFDKMEYGSNWWLIEKGKKL